MRASCLFDIQSHRFCKNFDTGREQIFNKVRFICFSEGFSVIYTETFNVKVCDGNILKGMYVFIASSLLLLHTFCPLQKGLILIPCKQTPTYKKVRRYAEESQLIDKLFAFFLNMKFE